MRIVLYVLSLLAGMLSLQWVLVGLLFGAFRDAVGKPAPPLLAGLFAALLALAYAIPVGMLIARGYIWFRRKRIAVPASFGWFSFSVACLAAAAVVLTLAGYAALMLLSEGRTGMSGIPLGMVLILCGLALAFVMPVVEIRDWRVYRRGVAQAG